MRSRAEDTCPSSSRPLGFSKLVAVMPSSAAFWFISATKAGNDPAVCSARATAAPLSEYTSISAMRASTVHTSPWSTLSWPTYPTGSAAARALIVTSSSGPTPCPTTTRAVISLVTEAGARTWSASAAHTRAASSTE